MRIINRDDYTYICRQTEPKNIRKMTVKQLVRRMAEIREYAVDSMMRGCEDCVDFETSRKDAHCEHCSRNMGDFFGDGKVVYHDTLVFISRHSRTSRK